MAICERWAPHAELVSPMRQICEAGSNLAYGRGLCKSLNMASQVRMTIAVATLLRVFLDDPSQRRYGYELMQLTGFPSGKLYPILARLERAGWLIKEREDIDPAAAGRPARRLYRLSPDGTQTARHELVELSEQPRLPATGLPGRANPEGGRA